MSYLHEQDLHKAIARLHMLGHPNPKRTGNPNAKAFGESLGAGLRNHVPMKTPAQTAASQMSPTEAAAQYGRYVKGTGAEVGMAQAIMPGVSGPEGSIGQNEAQYGRYVEGSYAPVGMMQGGLTDEASTPTDFLKLNNSLSGLRLGGRFTNSGLDEAAKQADANSNDRLYLKGMMHKAIDTDVQPGMAGSEVGAF